MRRPLSEEMKKEKRIEFVNKLKGLIGPSIVLLIIVALIVFVVTYQNKVVEEEPVAINAYTGDEKPIVLENDKLLLTMDPLTTQFSVKVKDTGKVWYSSPVGADDDSIANTSEKGKLKSNVLLTYSIQTGLKNTYDTASYCIENGIYDIEKADDNITIHYSIGKVEKEFYIPPICPVEEFESYLSNMSTGDKDIVKNYYKKYDINKLGKKDNKEELLETYPYLETEPCYVIRDGVKEKVKREMMGIFEGVGYTFEDYTRHKELALGGLTSEALVFNMDLNLKLEGEDLVVSCPMSSIESPSDYFVYEISLLPYFGAGSKSENGYMLVPEGGGALINFNNGKVSQSSYYANVYGWDMCLRRDAVVHETRTNYGVFGIADTDSNNSFICILEDGSSYAAITADISGKVNEYNYVNAVYSVKSREQYDVGNIANSSIYKYVDELPNEDYVQRYCFVESSDYNDMAKSYRTYIENKYGDNLSKTDDSSVPCVVEIVGAVDKVKQILGVPVSRPLELTTTEEATQMINYLVDGGVKNLDVKFTGWTNGGVKQNILKSVKPVSKVGNGKAIQTMVSDAKAKGVDVYLNGITQYEHDSNIFDGFFSFRDAAKYLSKERAVLYAYSDVTYAQREGTDTYYLLHTDLAADMARNLSDASSKYGANVSYDDLGSDLSSDFYKKNFHSRESAKNVQLGILADNNSSNQKVMVNRGNDYVIPYVDSIVNMNLRGNTYTILDEAVPFYQMALHGYVDYFGSPLNISGDLTQELLYSAEYGAGLSFTLMGDSSFALQKTLYTEYYAADFDVWNTRVVDIYNKYNSDLGHVFNKQIVNHDNVTDTLSVTTYEDGTNVYVNYGYESVTANGVTVPAREYLVVR